MKIHFYIIISEFIVSNMGFQCSDQLYFHSTSIWSQTTISFVVFRSGLISSTIDKQIPKLAINSTSAINSFVCGLLTLVVYSSMLSLRFHLQTNLRISSLKLNFVHCSNILKLILKRAFICSKVKTWAFK